MPESRTTLAEFAAENGGRAHQPHWLETIDEYDEVVAGYRSGLSPTVIHRWLTTLHDGVPSAHAIGSWLRAHHPRGRS
jgi:hypothetical protein